MNYVTDTHSLVWYFTDDRHLSKKALKSFESTVKEGQIIVPTVVFGRDTFYSQERPDETFAKLYKTNNIVIPAKETVSQSSFVIAKRLSGVVAILIL